MNKILKISILVVICLIIILGVALLIGQCSKKPADSTTTTTTTSSTTSSTTGSNNPPVCTEHVDVNADYLCDVCGEELERPNDSTYVETNDKIYVITTQLNLRKNPGETGVASVAVQMDQELTRLGYYTSGTNNGWSKVVYFLVVQWLRV